MTEFLGSLSNPWIVAIGSGIILLILGWLGRRIFKTDTNPVIEPSVTSKNENKNNQSTVVTNNFYPGIPTSGLPEKQHSTVTNENDVLAIKSKIKILFIENGAFKQISNLKNSGWNVSQVTDVTDLDSADIRTSQIIFVDYKDVGKRLSDQEGLGIVKALKQRYGKAKWIILYSAHSFQLNVFDSKADSFLAKNSTFIEIEQKIIEGAQKIAQ